MHKKILFITPAAPTRVESSVMVNFSNSISARGHPAEVFHCPSIRRLIAVVKPVLRSDVLVVHSSVAMVLFAVIVAKIFGKPVVGLVWDAYPVTLNGKRYDKRLLRRLLDVLEQFAIRTCNEIIVPSDDFKVCHGLSGASTLALWPPIGDGTIHATAVGLGNSRVSVIFAGQINATRGLEAAIEHLLKVADFPMRFEVASADALPAGLANHDAVTYLGPLSQNAVEIAIRNSDFGLVCLAEDFDGPGFPSKSLDYIKLGVPCLYYGPNLRNFINMLESTGVGLNVTDLATLEVSEVVCMHESFCSKRAAFERRACISAASVDKFLTIVSNL